MLAIARNSALRPTIVSASRMLSTASHAAPSFAYIDPAHSQDPSVLTTPRDIPPALREELESALRVDQAGELAANWIYKGQHDVLGRDPATGPLIQASTALPSPTAIFDLNGQDMWDQEKKHLAVMNKLQIQHGIRPTLLWEFARLGGYGLGAITALMGKEAAMACTEAVETVIGEHYDECVLTGAHDTNRVLTFPAAN